MYCAASLLCSSCVRPSEVTGRDRPRWELNVMLSCPDAALTLTGGRATLIVSRDSDG